VRRSGLGCTLRALLCGVVAVLFQVPGATGAPDAAKSTIFCYRATRTGGTALSAGKFARVSEDIICKVTPRKTDGTLETAATADFAALACGAMVDGAGAALACAVKTAAAVDASGLFIQTTLTTPPTVSAPLTALNIVATLAGGAVIKQGTLAGVGLVEASETIGANTPYPLVFSQEPTIKSTLSCVEVGNAAAAPFVRESTVIECTIAAKDITPAAVFSLGEDFARGVTVGGDYTHASVSGQADPYVKTGCTKSTLAEGLACLSQTLVFEVRSPAYPSSFQMTGQLADATAFEGGATAYTVVGTPTTASRVSCVGDGTGLAVVREGGNVTCTIRSFSASGITSAFPTDFGTGTVVSDGTNPGVSSSETVIAEVDGNTAGIKFVYGVHLNASAENGDTVTFTPKLTGGANLAAAATIQVIGTPTKESVLSCVGSETGAGKDFVLVSETVTCTINVKDVNDNACLGLETDFQTPESDGGTSIGLIQESGSSTSVASIFQFSIDAPAAQHLGTHLFNTTVKTAAGLAITSSPVGLKVLGRATRASTVACAFEGQALYVREAANVTCTYTPRDEDGIIAADFTHFGKAVGASGVDTRPPLDGQGVAITFTAVAPAAGRTFQLTGALSDGQYFTSLPFAFADVLGTPSRRTTLSCESYKSGNGYIRLGEVAQCVISIADSAGAPTTGLASDFIVNGTENTGGGMFSPLTSQAGFTEVSFNVTETGGVVDGIFEIVVSLASSFDKTKTTNPADNIANNFTYLVLGSPTSASVLTCVGDETGSATVVKTSEQVTCTIDVKNGVGFTTALAADFATPTSVGGTSISTRTATKTNAGTATAKTAITFTVDAPGTPGLNSFNISVALAAQFGNAALADHLFPTVVGRPTIKSTLSCTPLEIRHSQNVTCTITATDNAGATTGFGADFTVTTLGGVTAKGLVATATGATFTTLHTAPATSGGTFTVTGADAVTSVPFSSGAVSFLVMGTPAVNSIIVCQGDNTASSDYVRASGTASCVITVRNTANTAVNAFVTDFADPDVVGVTLKTVAGKNVTRVTNGATMTVKLDAPASVGTTCQYVGKLASGATFTEGAKSIVTIGTPTANSNLSCTGASSGTEILEAGEIANCVITVNDAGGPTTALATDFGLPVSTGSSVTVPQFVGGGSTMTFSVVAPPATTTKFTVTGSLSAALGGANFSQGEYVLSMVGTATVASKISCVGERSGTTSVRQLEVTECTIQGVDSLGSDTNAQKTQFATPLLVGGTFIAGENLTGASDYSVTTIKVKAPAAVTAFSVLGRLSDTSAFSQGQQSLTVVGTPNNFTNVSCVGDRSGRVTDVRRNESITCTVYFHDTGGIVTGVAADLGLPDVTGSVYVGLQSAVAVNPPSGANAATFTFKANMTEGDAVMNLFMSTSNNAQSIVGSPQSIEVVGIPSNQSTLVCIGADANENARARQEDTVTCTVAFVDDHVGCDRRCRRFSGKLSNHRLAGNVVAHAGDRPHRAHVYDEGAENRICDI
jgi:hypothetical protein